MRKSYDDIICEYVLKIGYPINKLSNYYSNMFFVRRKIFYNYLQFNFNLANLTG